MAIYSHLHAGLVLCKRVLLYCTRSILFDPIILADSATTILGLLGRRNYSESVGGPDPVHVHDCA